MDAVKRYRLKEAPVHPVYKLLDTSPMCDPLSLPVFEGHLVQNQASKGAP
jgi:hypothetical protein